MSRKPNVVKFPLVALTLIAFTAAKVASGDDAKSPGQAESAASSLPSAPAPAKRMVVWDGEQAVKGTGWTNPKTCSIGPQTVEAHSGNTAVEFKFKGDGDWLGAGWNWCAFQTGPYGTDISAMKKFTFWIKSKGKITDLQINLLCNGPVFDMPEHHTEKVSVLAYCPQLSDGQWHQVSIPLTDLKQPKGFDPLHVGELQMFNAGAGDGSYFFDDLAFE
jgi:Carbohydrate binding domain (family 11)